MLITKIYKVVFSVFLLMLLTACGKATPTEPESWFTENKDTILEMNQLLLSHPAIKRVDPGMREKFVKNYDAFSDEDKRVYSTLKEKCELLGVRNIQNARFGNANEGELVAISYLLRSSGYVFSGGSILAVEYNNDTELLEKLRKEGTVIKPLPLKDWYVVHSKWE